MVFHPIFLPPSLLQAPSVLQPSSLPLALLACLCMAVLHVATLYFLPASIRQRHRDDATHVKARFFSVVAACLLSIRIFLLFAVPSPDAVHPVYEWLGLTGWTNPAIFLPFLAMACLFLGPIVVMSAETYYDRRYEVAMHLSSSPLVFRLRRRRVPLPLTWYDWWERRRVAHRLTKETLWRNLVVAPLTEEIVFRACMLPLLYQASSASSSLRSSRSTPFEKLIFLSPLFFGLAHAHHALQRVREGLPPKQALFEVTLQVAYTSIFGWQAAFLFLRTGSLLPCILTHSFCNFMGLPNLGFLLPPASLMPSPASAFFLHVHRWKFLFVYLLGIVLFVVLLFPCSDPTLFHGGRRGGKGGGPFYWQ